MLLVAYFAAGVFGRFPWKADEPYYFGVMWQMLQSGDWSIPRLAGQPFMEKPPLTYWLGALFMRLLPAWPAHESARIAVPVLVSLSVAAVYGCARILVRELPLLPREPDALPGRGPSVAPTAYAMVAILLIPGCLGFSEHVHKLTADLVQMTGAVVALLGMVKLVSIETVEASRARRTAVIAGLLAGTGTGIAFMAKGLLVPGVLACTAMLCLAIPSFRTRYGLMAAAVALTALLPWVWLWPSHLLVTAPELFDEWLFTHNIGRFVGATRLGGNVSFENKVQTLLIAAGPVAALCVGTLAVFGRNIASFTAARAPAHRCIAFYVASCLMVLGASAVLRDNYLLPLLPGLVLFGLPSLYLHPGAVIVKRVLDLTFAALALGILLIWLGLVRVGAPWLPDALTAHLRDILPIPFHMPFDYLAVTVAACALTAWWFSTRYERLRSATLAWCSGVAMLWSLAMTLLLPWIDAARSYESLFNAMEPQLTARASCVATVNLGESELALLQYVTGIEPTRGHLGISGAGEPDRPNPSAERCDRLLVLSNRHSGPIVPCTRKWTLEWSGHRPADRRERFALYRRSGDGNAPDEHGHHVPVSMIKSARSPFVASGVAACRGVPNPID